MDSNCESVHRVLSSYRDFFFQLKDIVEDAIEGKLDTTHFPCLSNQRGISSRSKVPARYNQCCLYLLWPRWWWWFFSYRYGQWHRKKSLSRVIVFVIGGATFSEARCGYEISREKQDSWEVVVGKLGTDTVQLIRLLTFPSRWRHSYPHPGDILVECSTFWKVIALTLHMYLYHLVFPSIKTVPMQQSIISRINIV